MSNIKLYRGLQANDFTLVDQEMIAWQNEAWRKILAHRDKTSEYPEHLNNLIIQLHKETRLNRQVFTESRSTAKRYIAGKDGGILIELSVPINDILQYFELEIQNYSKRRQCFEVVYTIRSSVLAEFMQAWHCRITSNKSI